MKKLRRLAGLWAGWMCLSWSALAGADLAPVSPEFRVDADGDYGQTRGSAYSSAASPAVRFPDGSFVVVWSKRSFPMGILAQRYDGQGTKLGTSFTVTSSSGYYGFSAAELPSNGFVVVWGEYVGGGARVSGQRMNAGGTALGTEFVVNTSTASQIYSPDVASLPGGGFVVVWQSTIFGYNTTEQNVLGQRLNGVGAKLGTEFLLSQSAAGYQTAPRVASGSDGRFVTVWQAGGNISGRLFAASGSPATNEFVVNTFTTYGENAPDVAMNSSGGFVVVWGTPYGDDAPGGGLGDHSVTLRRFAASGAPLADEFHLNAYITGDQGNPKIAMDDDGSFVVVWESASNYFFTDNRDGDGAGIFGRCFDAAGVPQGGDFMVNTYTTGDQAGAGIATDGKGNFVVAWTGAYVTFNSPYLTRTAGVAGRRFSLGGGGPGPAFTVEKTDNGASWTAGVPLTYKITVNSLGQASSNVVVTEIVPEKTTFQPSASTAGWSCDPDNTAGSVCTLALGNLAQDASRTVDFVVTVAAGTSSDWELFNDALADRDAAGGGREFACNGPAEDVTPAALSLQNCVSDPSGCLNLFCRAVPADPICTELAGTAPLHGSAVRPRAVTCPPGGPPPSPLGRALLRARDRILDETRGGERLIDLTTTHSDDLRTAVDTDPSLVSLLSSAVAMPGFEDAVRDFSNDVPVAGTMTQVEVNLLNGFLDALEAAAPAALLATLQRERARLGIDGWVGKTLDEIIMELNKLTCEGFETLLFCGELTGDCLVTATDALIVLQIGVGSKPFRGEADLNGDLIVVATDALRTLLIAVGADPPTNACNVVP